MKNTKYLSLMGLGLFLSSPEFYESEFSGKPRSSGSGREYNPSKGIKKVIPKGCQEYTIKGITVIAISEKSAIKKVNKIINKKPC